MKFVKNDIVGKKFGSLTVLDEFRQIGEPPNRKTYWKCRCNCGNEVWVCRGSILHKRSNYCNNCRPSGVRNEKLYHIYYGIKERCYNSNNPKFSLYGGKGVRMCDEWLDGYESFKSWALHNGYEEGLTIDRINPDDDYSPRNCRWITIGENSARANVGRHKNKSKLEYMYAVSDAGDVIKIDNILRFSESNGLKYSTVVAALHGRCKPRFGSFELYSNKTKNDNRKSVETIEMMAQKKYLRS